MYVPLLPQGWGVHIVHAANFCEGHQSSHLQEEGILHVRLRQFASLKLAPKVGRHTGKLEFPLLLLVGRPPLHQRHPLGSEQRECKGHLLQKLPFKLGSNFAKLFIVRTFLVV